MVSVPDATEGEALPLAVSVPDAAGEPSVVLVPDAIEGEAPPLAVSVPDVASGNSITTQQLHYITQLLAQGKQFLIAPLDDNEDSDSDEDEDPPEPVETEEILTKQTDTPDVAIGQNLSRDLCGRSLT